MFRPGQTDTDISSLSFLALLTGRDKCGPESTGTGQIACSRVRAVDIENWPNSTASTLGVSSLTSSSNRGAERSILERRFSLGSQQGNQFLGQAEFGFNRPTILSCGSAVQAPPETTGTGTGLQPAGYSDY